MSDLDAYRSGPDPFEISLSHLADHECRHGRLPSDATPPCGCYPLEEGQWKEATA